MDEQRFALSARGDPSAEAGLVRDEIGRVWLVLPDGSRQLLSGGGSQPGAACWHGPLKVNAFAGQQLEDQVAGSVAGGTYTVTYGANTTAALDWNGSAADLKTALEGLASIGAGNIVSVTGTDVNGGYILQFAGLAVTALLTADSTNLTGPDAPYNVGGLGYTSVLPFITLANGDVLDGFLWQFPSGIDIWDSGATLEFYDNPNSIAGAPAWTPTSPYGAFKLDSAANDFTNFLTPPDPANSEPTVDQLMIAKWIADTSQSLSDLPVVATGAVTIYAVTTPGSPPTQGVVWCWVRLATPAALP